ncbi:hypothetical protein SAMN05216533_8513 [Streptomyces sp. Ag109_O5-10]|nr:hypothetical protein SAMN05216533_0032 [Streptomyces sp. Ag109_O5-10]SEF17768.1 hypothetical protein SAMN05216533_8513 [Streptomyces sp. Ag109_O5-10]
MQIAPNDINDTRLQLRRLAERGIPVETVQGLFTQPRPQPPRGPRPAHPSQLTGQ